MAEAAQNRVQNAMKDFINNIDRTKLRPIQKQMYVCNAQCMDDPSASMEEVGEVKALTFFKFYFVKGPKVCGEVFRTSAEGPAVCPVRA